MMATLLAQNIYRRFHFCKKYFKGNQDLSILYNRVG